MNELSTFSFGHRFFSQVSVLEGLIKSTRTDIEEQCWSHMTWVRFTTTTWAILKNLNECCLSLGMHRSCSENRHGRLASWENHYTLHPLANIFPVVRKLPWQKQTPKGVETTPWARRCRLRWWSSQSETWVLPNWCMISWLFHSPVSGMQRSYCGGVAAQDMPGFFVGNDCMGRGRGRCSFDMSWPSSGFATSPLVHQEWQVSFQLMQWRVLCWATQL